MAKKRTRKPPSIGGLQLAEVLARGERAPCYLLLGKESFLREQAQEALREALMGANPGPSYSEFDGPKADLAHVLDELRTMPFLGAKHRLVVVRKAGPQGNAKGFIGEHGEVLARFLASPPSASTLVLVADKVDKRYKTSKALLKAATEVDCGPFEERALRGFLNERALHWGRSFARGAAGALRERRGGQEVALAQIDAEVRKLASAGTGPIKIADIDALASFGSNTDSFALIGRIACGDAEGALEVLHRALRDGLVAGKNSRTRDPTGIAMILVPTLRWDLTRLIKGRTLLNQGRRGFDIAQELRVYRDKSSFLERIGRASLEDLAARHAVLRQADSALRHSSNALPILTDVVLRLALAERGQVPVAMR
jgi:DNA polymerase-3 subunit delta